MQQPLKGYIVQVSTLCCASADKLLSANHVTKLSNLLLDFSILFLMMSKST